MDEVPQLDLSGPEAVYKQIANHLRQRIARGDYRSGDRLPSESQLMQELGVSRLTARRSYDVLVNAGVVRKERGVGAFVRGGAAALNPRWVRRRNPIQTDEDPPTNEHVL